MSEISEIPNTNEPEPEFVVPAEVLKKFILIDREKSRLNCAAYYSTHKETIAEARRAKYLANREAILDAQRARYASLNTRCHECEVCDMRLTEKQLVRHLTTKSHAKKVAAVGKGPVTPPES